MGALEISGNFNPPPTSRLSGASVFDFGWARIALLPAAPYAVHGKLPTHLLGLALERQRGVHAVGGGRRGDFDALPGELACTAPGVDLSSESPQGGEYLTVHVAEAALTDLGGSRLAIPPRAVFQGQRYALQLGWQLRRLMLAETPQTSTIESRAALLLDLGAALLDKPPPLGAYIADKARHARVLDHIEEALDAPLALQDLAALARMPLLRFLRSFSAVVGCTPHSYVMDRRLQRARALLSRTSGGDASSIADIAACCGFSHQSHLGAAFKARLGMTPHECRIRFTARHSTPPGIRGRRS